MATQSVNAVITDLDDLPGDIDEDADSSTKHDTISVRGSRPRSSHQNKIRISKLDRRIQKEQSKNPRKGKSSKGKPWKPPTFDCEICAESKPEIEKFPINECSHSYCNDCVSKYIAAKLQDNILSITCPASGCPARFEPEQCRLILPREVFDRWGDALCEALVMGSKRFYCPHKDCSALVYLDESEDDEKMKESECPHCHRMVCVACGTKWHPEVTCEEFQKLAENERETGDILLKKMAESHKWKRCPSCKFYIEKSQGCLYMKCRCGLAFCYNCGTPSKDHSHYCYNCKH